MLPLEIKKRTFYQYKNLYTSQIQSHFCISYLLYYTKIRKETVHLKQKVFKLEKLQSNYKKTSCLNIASIMKSSLNSKGIQHSVSK